MNGMTQITPAQLRAQAEDNLRDLGRQRLGLLAQLEEIDQELKPRIRAAREVELPYSRITTLTGVAPNTARAWVAEQA